MKTDSRTQIHAKNKYGLNANYVCDNRAQFQAFAYTQRAAFSTMVGKKKPKQGSASLIAHPSASIPVTGTETRCGIPAH